MKKRIFFTVICILASLGAWAYEDPIILPWGVQESWQMKFVKDPSGGYDDPQPGVDANGFSWTQPGYDDSQWETLTGPMANGTLDAPNGPRPILYPNYSWEDDGIGHSFCLRRTFSLDTVNPDGYTFVANNDDWVTVHINGQEICDDVFGYNAFPISASLLHEGENLLTISFYADAGWYNFLDYALFSGNNYIDYSVLKSGDLWYNLDFKNNTAEVCSPRNGTSYLGSIVIPEIADGKYAVTSIGNHAFDGSKIEEITIPSSIKSIGWDAFWDCGSLEKVYITDLDAWCRITFDNRESNPLHSGGKLYFNGSRITALAIPESFTGIKDYAFSGGKFTSLTIPNTLTTIGAAAFQGCTTLRTATINNAEGSCELKSIGFNAFCDCSSMNSINFTKYPTYIGEAAFARCGSLTSIELNDGLTAILPRTFLECSNLTTVNIPNSLTSIGESAFDCCGNLSGGLILPEGLTTVGVRAFTGCGNVETLSLPNTLTTVGDEAFSGTGRWRSRSLYIPSSVTSIGCMAFVGNSSTLSIIVAEDNPKYDSRNNCNAIIETRTGKLLAGCRNTIIPEGVTSLERASLAWLPNTIFIVPNTVEEIKENAFAWTHQDDWGFRTLVLGSGVTDIGPCICYGGIFPPDVYCYATDVPITDGEAFSWAYSPGPGMGTLHVPAESIEEYKTTAPWSYFTDYVPITGDERFTVDVYLCESFDNSTRLNYYNGYDANVTLERTFHKDGKWNTLCLPFSVTAKQMEEWEHPLREATIVRLEPSASSLKADGTLDVLFVKTDNIEAGKPYLVKWEEGDDLVEPVFKNVLLTCTEPTSIEFANELGTEQCKFVGQFSPFYVTDENIDKIVQLSADNQPFYSTESEVLFSSLAHFEIDGTVTDSNIKFRGIEGTGVDVEIGSTGYATLYDVYGDLSIPTGVTAYTGVLNNNYIIELTSIGQNMPIKTPVVLQGAEGIYHFPYTSNAEPVGENDLKGTAEPLVTTGTQYVLSEIDDISLFLLAEAGNTISAGSAYLEIDAPLVKMLFFSEDDATGIKNFNVDLNNVIYNVVGQRLNKMQKGINIVGGRKVLK